MRLYAYVLQAKDLPVKDSYVKLQMGKLKSKTRVLTNTENPVWNEEFVFRVHDVDEDDIVLSVFHHEEDSGLFNGSAGLVGRVRIPVRSVAGEVNHTLLPTWFALEKPSHGKFVNIECGKILVSLSLHGRGPDTSTNYPLYANSDINVDDSEEFEGSCKSSHDLYSSKEAQKKFPERKQLMKAIANRVERIFSKKGLVSKGNDSDSSDLSIRSEYEDHSADEISESSRRVTFEDGLEMMQSREDDQEMPADLLGGVLLDQTYLVSPSDLNKFLFTPGSQFRNELAEIQATTDLQEGPWEWKEGDAPCLTRVVSYIKAATKLVKAVKATEEQTYVKADGQHFAVHVDVSTPDVPYGNTFKIELLYKIKPGPELSSGEESSKLIISWGINFHQSTLMKGMIENGAKQGLKESFEQFTDLLAKKFRVMGSVDLSDKDQVLGTLQEEKKSDLKSAFEYFWNFTVVSAIVMSVYVLIHILCCEPGKIQGLEFYGLDLPDSFGELFICGILVLQVERAFEMVSHFIQARLHGGSSNGVRAIGEGWILTIALIEGSNFAPVKSEGLSDPYVVFTCNGKTRRSSVKLQAQDPQWNEVIEFDAMEEPPSILDVEIFDFDGPFDHATSLGHAEINFLKHTSNELADLWIPLQGKLALASQSKLHLRIFLDNNNGVETIKDYLTKMEKEVGKKLNLRSPHKNSAFQKLFGLPQEEFLIKEFTCSLKRKMPLQGRLYLSARIVGFYANFFGHKTKFFFLWEDIDDVQVLPPTLASVGSSFLVIILKKDRGLNAKHCAKSQDEEGRLRFYFQSFVSFDDASRTIVALWKTRTLNPDQKEQITEEQRDQTDSTLMPEDVGLIMDADETKMTKIYASELPINVNSLMELFDGGELEHRIMEKSGCLNYTSTAWQIVKPGVYQRCLSYKFNRHVSVFGGEARCTQQKTSALDNKGCVVTEVMALQDVPFDDHFRVHLRYMMEKSGLAYNACKCEVYLGITWLKSNKFQQRITHNITQKFTTRFRDIFDVVQTEIVIKTPADDLL